MKIIILVLGCEDYPYKAIQDGQMNTWDSVQVDNVDTYFYMGNDKHEGETELVVQTIVSPFKEKSVTKHKKLFVPCSEDYNMMHWRYKLALDYIWNEDWDFIFRTNTSSYVDKQKLFDFANTMMTEKCYCGVDGGGYASGCGVLISRDVAKIFKDQFDSHPTDSDDCLMGTYATKNGIEVTKGAVRFDYYFNVFFNGNERDNHCTNIPNIYHYRCKSDTIDRTKDIQAFHDIHKTK